MNEELSDFQFIELPYTKHGKRPPLMVYTRRSKQEVLSDIAILIGMSDPDLLYDDEPILEPEDGNT